MSSYLVKNSNGEIKGNRVLSYLVPKGSTEEQVTCSLDARKMGTVLVGSRGCGKSLLQAEMIYTDARQHIPAILLDPTSGAINHFMRRVLMLSPEERKEIWERVVYVDPSCETGYAVPFPLFFKAAANEPLLDVGERYLQILKAQDPHLVEAPVTGWNAVYDVGSLMTMSLVACGAQISEGMDFLHNPQKWGNWLRQLPPGKHPELPSLIAGIDNLVSHKGADLQKKIESLMSKIKIFAMHPIMEAMFGSNTPGVSWHDFIAKRKIVLIDLSKVQKAERKKFMVWWFYSYFTDQIKRRSAGRHIPVSLYIDELSVFISGTSSKAQEMFIEEFSQLINVYSRNCGLYLHLGLQEIGQMPEGIHVALATMGNWIIGNVADPKGAETLAKLFCKYDPRWQRKTQSVWMSDEEHLPYAIDQATTEYSLDEQWELYKQQFMQQKKLTFRVKLARGEGDMRGDMRGVSIEHLAQGKWFSDEKLAEVKRKLSMLHGVPISQITEEIRLRQQQLAELSTVKMTAEVKPVVVSHEEVAAPAIRPLPAQNRPPQPQKQHNGGGGNGKHNNQPQNSNGQPTKGHNGNGKNGQQVKGGQGQPSNNNKGNGQNSHKPNGTNGKVPNQPAEPAIEMFFGKN